MRYRLVIFDFDGTVADSFGVFLRAFNECAVRYGVRRIEEDQIDELRGIGSRALQARLAIPAWKTPLIARDMRRRMRANLQDVRLFPGMGSVIERLADSGVALAIVTSNSEQNVRDVLGRDLAGHFRFYGCGASIFGKAQRFRKILRRTGTPVDSVLSIGDETRDAEAAARIGIDFGAVTWGYAQPATLAAWSPRVMFDRAEEILGILS